MYEQTRKEAAETEIRIRMAEQQDIPALCRLRLAYFDEEFGRLPQEQLSAIAAQLPD